MAHRFERPLAAEMDESEHSPGARGANVLAAPFQGCGHLRPHTAHASSGHGCERLDGSRSRERNGEREQRA